MADRITCTPSPGRGYVGVLPTLEHNVGGTLFIRDNKTFVIRGFTYDGQGPGTYYMKPECVRGCKLVVLYWTEKSKFVLVESLHEQYRQ